MKNFRRAVDLYYGDESGVNLEPNVPYGWQFRGEEVAMPSGRDTGINCFGIFTRNIDSWTAVSEKAISGQFLTEQLERFSFSIGKLTVVVLDNARIHDGKQMIKRQSGWQARGLLIFYFQAMAGGMNIKSEPELKECCRKGIRRGTGSPFEI